MLAFVWLVVRFFSLRQNAAHRFCMHCYSNDLNQRSFSLCVFAFSLIASIFTLHGSMYAVFEISMSLFLCRNNFLRKHPKLRPEKNQIRLIAFLHFFCQNGYCVDISIKGSQIRVLSVCNTPLNGNWAWLNLTSFFIFYSSFYWMNHNRLLNFFEQTTHTSTKNSTE